MRVHRKYLLLFFSAMFHSSFVLLSSPRPFQFGGEREGVRIGGEKVEDVGQPPFGERRGICSIKSDN